MSTPIHTEAPVIPLIDDDEMGSPLVPADIAPGIWIAVIEQSQYIETQFVGLVTSEVTTDSFGLPSFTAIGFTPQRSSFTTRIYLQEAGIEPSGHARHNDNRTYLLPEGMSPFNHEEIAGKIWVRWFNGVLRDDEARRAQSSMQMVNTDGFPVIMEPVELRVSVPS